MIDILKYINFDLTWHVVGNGPDENNLKKMIENLPHNIKVVFHGYLNKIELNQFYKTESINLFCSLSSSEGLPVSMMEAISYGIPIMSTDVGGCHEICNENTGFLIQKDFLSLSHFIQIAIARGSLSFRFTAFSVRFTFLIQEQKRVAEAFLVFFRICEGILLGLRNF
jgi:glycosyltransferase involved in cell wall biosynthesis